MIDSWAIGRRLQEVHAVRRPRQALFAKLLLEVVELMGIEPMTS
jgi:hypothetical protein